MRTSTYIPAKTQALVWNLTSAPWLHFFMDREFSCFIFQGNVLSIWSLRPSESLIYHCQGLLQREWDPMLCCVLWSVYVCWRRVVWGGDREQGGWGGSRQRVVSSLIPKNQVDFFWVIHPFITFCCLSSPLGADNWTLWDMAAGAGQVHADLLR